MINTYSSDSKGAKSKTDQRRAERERQMAIMDSLISDFEQSAASGGPGPVRASIRSSASDAESHTTSRRGSDLTMSDAGSIDARLPPAPTGAVENARKFLWDEDHDDTPESFSPPGLGLSGPGSPSAAQQPTSSLLSSTSARSNTSGSRYRASTNTHGLGDSFSNILSQGLSDAPGYHSSSAGASGRMPGRGSAMPGRGSSIGGSGRTGDGGRRSSIDFTQVFKPFEGIRTSIVNPFGGGTSKTSMMDSVNLERNIAPRRGSGGDDDFADMIDARAADAGPGWADATAERMLDGWGTASYVIGDCCQATGRAAGKRRNTLLLVAAAALIVIIATSVGTSVQRSDNGTSASSSVEAPRAPPTGTSSAASGTAASAVPEVGTPTSEQDGPRISFGNIVDTFDDSTRFGSMRRRILESGLSRDTDLQDVYSPQYKALKWIADMDGASLSLKDHGILQRYSLAVLFFSTFSSNELPTLDSLKDLEDKPVTALGEGWKDRTNWLTSKGHCSWAGVQCHHRDGTSLTNTVYDGNEGVTVLNLTANNLDGTLPGEIKGLGDLRILDLGDNLIQGTLPAALGHLEALQMLYLDGNGIDGTLPRSMGELVHVTHIYMSNNYLEGQIPVELSNLSNLHTLALYQNSLTGTLPDLSGLSALEYLYLDSNYITGEMPESLADLTALTDLRLGDNELTGAVPARLCELDSLVTLYLEENFIGGSIMDCVGNMKSLAELQLYGNRVGGSIPDAIGDLPSLEILYIDDNELEGPLPSSLGKLENLISVYAQNNLLTGQIPQELSALTNLQRLYLHENRLQGQVPAQLGALKSLQKVRLHGNDLSGQVPMDICMLKDHSLVDLQGDCAAGKLECDCCTQCH